MSLECNLTAVRRTFLTEHFIQGNNCKIQLKTLLKPCASEHCFFSIFILCLCPEASRDKCLTTKLYSINEVSSAVASESYYLSWFHLISCSMHINGWKMERYSQLKNKNMPKVATGCFEVIGHYSLCKLLSSSSWQNPAVFFTQKPLVPAQRQTFINLHCIQIPL